MAPNWGTGRPGLRFGLPMTMVAKYFLNIDELRSDGSRLAESCVTTVCDKAFVYLVHCCLAKLCCLALSPSLWDLGHHGMF